MPVKFVQELLSVTILMCEEVRAMICHGAPGGDAAASLLRLSGAPRQAARAAGARRRGARVPLRTFVQARACLRFEREMEDIETDIHTFVCSLFCASGVSW